MSDTGHVTTSRLELARSFGLRLGSAMLARGWRPMPSVLVRHFNQVHPGQPITLYAARSWLHGQFMPRPDKLISLAQCLRVPPHQLMYGEFYRQHGAHESAPAWVLSEREHRLIQCLRRLPVEDHDQIERLAWQRLVQALRS